MKMTIAAFVAASMLAGCAGFGMQGMSAQEIAAASKDKSASGYCMTFTGAGGQVQTLYVNADKSTIANGRATLKCGNAEATFEDSGKPQAVKP